MRNKITRRFVILLQLALLFGGMGVAQAVTPMVAAGSTHTVALKNDGTLLTWGYDTVGQLGQGYSIPNATTPILLTGLGQVRAFAAGMKHTLALKEDGTVWAWGDNDWGQLGDGTKVTVRVPDPICFSAPCTKTIYGQGTPGQVQGLIGVTAIAAGRLTSFALKQDGTVWAWGMNMFGALGDGSTTSSSLPVQVKSLIGVKAITAGYRHGVALKQDGTVWAWGDNYEGQLGNGTTTPLTTINLASQVPGLTGVTAIAAGNAFTIALKSDGTVWGWGNNGRGYLGDGTKTQRTTPVQVLGLTGVRAIAGLENFTLALKQDGSVWAWGDDSLGVTGPIQNCGNVFQPACSVGPKRVLGLPAITAIGAGNAHALALAQDGATWVWGKNDVGQLGLGTVDAAAPVSLGPAEVVVHSTPAQIPGLSGATSVWAGSNISVAQKQDGSLWIWGSNEYRQLGIGNGNITPKPLPGMVAVSAIAAGTSHTLALKQDGTLWAWGSNTSSQLGDGSTTDRTTPVQVPGVSGVTAIGTRASHTVALKQGGTVWAWGDNTFGQLGDGSTTRRSTAIQVPGLTGFSAIAVGKGHTVGLKQDGTVWAWGSNQYGQLGTGFGNTTPAQVAGLTAAIAVAAGNNHTLALKQDGTVWAWGYNNYGQLGDGSNAIHGIPAQVPGLTGVRAIAAGGEFSLAEKQDGTVWAWGYNYAGQLGDASTVNRSTPVQVSGLTGIASITGGDLNTFVAMPDGTVLAWGNNLNGQLGDGTYATHLIPAVTTNEAANGPLDLIPESPNNIPADKIPPYWLQVTKAADVATAITYNSDDLNKEGSVYVVAYLDPASPLLGGSAAVPRAAKAAAGAAPAPSAPVPAVLTRSGWKQMNTAAPTEPLYSGPLIPSKNTFAMYEASKFDNTKDNGLFCVAYAGASANSAKGLIRSVVSGVDANLNQCPPLLVGISATLSNCLFNWAERTYPQYFAPAPAPSATYGPYYYRYYPGTGNYLATSSADSHVWALGNMTGGNLLDLGPPSNYSGAAGCQ